MLKVEKENKHEVYKMRIQGVKEAREIKEEYDKVFAEVEEKEINKRGTRRNQIKNLKKKRRNVRRRGIIDCLTDNGFIALISVWNLFHRDMSPTPLYS